jgi:NADH:ubiquinone oxidoreductase subunit H
MILMIFLCEYLHLVISSIHFILFFWGGWLSFKLYMVLPPIFSSYHDSIMYNYIFIGNTTLAWLF